MKRLLTSTALALCLGGTAAHAQMQPQMEKLSAGGYWATYGGKNAAGRLQCSVRTTYHRGDGAMEGAMTIVYDAGNPSQLGIQIMKDSWNIPTGAQMRVAMQVDNAPVKVFYAHQWYRPQEVELEMQLSDTDPSNGSKVIEEMVNLFANGVWLKVWFPDGNEGVWTASLTGSAAQLNTLNNCIRAIGDTQNANAPSQPYGKTPQQLPPTQRTATQPYTPL